MDLIKTTSKSKLFKGIVYPVGAERISQVLAGIPQYEQIGIHFQRSTQVQLWQRKQGYTKDTPIYLISLCYYHFQGIDQLEFLDRWQICVNAVPSELAQSIRALLLKEGFSLMRNWFAAPRTQSWLASNKYLSIQYIPSANRLITSEDSNA